MEGFVYLLHFAAPISDRHTTRHYLGWSEDVEQRFQQHKAGKGARLTQVALEKGIDFWLVMTWPGSREFERLLKSRKQAPQICPICGQHHPKGRVRVCNSYTQLSMDFDDDAWAVETQARAAEIDAYRAFRANRRTSFALGDTSGIIPF